MTARKKMHGLLTTVGLLVLAGTTLAKEIPTVRAERVGMSTERLERVAQMNQRYIDEGKFVGIATAVVRDGKLVHQSVQGNKGINDPRPLAVDDLFRIYSMTKPITAVAMMQLYEQGKFLLTDPVSKFIPEFKNMTVLKDGEVVPAEGEMTMRQLLTHTTGLTYGFGFDPDDALDKMYGEAKLWLAKDLDDFIERLAALPLRYEPGNRYHYSVGIDKDPDRPFRVRTDNATVEAIGTRFNVYRRDDATEVTVIEGRVQVDWQTSLVEDNASSRYLELGAGGKTVVSEHQAMPTVSPANVERATAWTERRLDFDGETVAAVVAEFNRYNRSPIVIDDPGLAERRITGVFDVNDPGAFVALLGGLNAIEIEVTGEGHQAITSKKATQDEN